MGQPGSASSTPIESGSSDRTPHAPEAPHFNALRRPGRVDVPPEGSEPTRICWAVAARRPRASRGPIRRLRGRARHTVARASGMRSSASASCLPGVNVLTRCGSATGGSRPLSARRRRARGRSGHGPATMITLAMPRSATTARCCVRPAARTQTPPTLAKDFEVQNNLLELPMRVRPSGGHREHFRGFLPRVTSMGIPVRRAAHSPIGAPAAEARYGNRSDRPAPDSRKRARTCSRQRVTWPATRWLSTQSNPTSARRMLRWAPFAECLKESGTDGPSCAA